MDTAFSVAAAAYGQAQSLISGNSSGKLQQVAIAQDTPSFGDMVSQSVQQVVDQGAKSDQLTMDMVKGKANVVDVVTALSQTELAVQSMTAIRDRVISAYESIMQMPI